MRYFSVYYLIFLGIALFCQGTRPGNRTAVEQSSLSTESILNRIQCSICELEKLQGSIADCRCQFESVNYAVENFFIPHLQNITSRAFFRYFRVNLDNDCPFWQEDGQCMLEACAIGSCDVSEIPKSWIQTQPSYGDSMDVGWISENNEAACNQSTIPLAAYSPSIIQADRNANPMYVSFLKESQEIHNEIDWTDMPENCDYSESGTYVNLLRNPERYTGYAGPSARRVWQSITEENCFGESEDTCLEKRVFFRLMGGLRASISTHVAREYFYSGTQRWDKNVPLFIQAVGAHRDRVDNLYFTFLFLLRAVTKARDVIINFPFHTGNETDDRLAMEAVRDFLEPNRRDSFRYSNSLPIDKIWRSDLEADITAIETSDMDVMVEECRNGFDESTLFQVSPSIGYGNDVVMEKQMLLEGFRDKFRNISRIMDCVSCEKCRLWGKLQILGIGTAIKILLSPREEVMTKDFLTRQELVALVNVLHQVGKSVQFASRAIDYEFQGKLQLAGQSAGFVCMLFAMVSMFSYYCWRRRISSHEINKDK